MSSTPNSLIMGVAAHYPAEMLLPFLQSLRQTSYQGKVCLFVGQMTPEAVAQIRSYAEDVIVLDGEYGARIAHAPLPECVALLAWARRTRRVRRLYPGLFKAVCRFAASSARKSLQWDMEQALEGFQSLRYGHYLHYLETQAPAADYVMLSDVRDVVFQDDPFKHFNSIRAGSQPSAELHVVLEAEHVTIGNEPFDSRWIRNLYGTKTLMQFHDKPVSCSGTTMGTAKGMRRYLAAMGREIAAQTRPLGSHDQGIHNYLLWSRRLDPVTVHANGYGPVLTLGLEKRVVKDKAGRLLNCNGECVPVVHQYDRHPALAEELCRALAMSGAARKADG